jgi:polysaccharide deacetylase 2 family uncharacterized protein YibQ
LKNKFKIKNKKEGFFYTLLTTSIFSVFLLAYYMLLSDPNETVNNNSTVKNAKELNKTKIADIIEIDENSISRHNELIDRMKNLIKQEEELLTQEHNLTEYSNSEAKDYLESLQDKNNNINLSNITNSKNIINKDHKFKSDVPKLAIIIDDVAYNSQIKKIRNLGFPVTPSFFPSDKNHKFTKNYAQSEKIVMVHLPLEAINYANEEIDTLKTWHSKGKIDKRIRQIKEDFPNIKFINNHTGSKFTSNYRSMKYLLEALKRENITFVDSVTTHKTKIFYVARDTKSQYLKRDIFLDNIQEINYILKQFKKAVKIAKENGQAVAIAHPHRKTFQALSKIRPLLDGVELVYIDELQLLSAVEAND